MQISRRYFIGGLCSAAAAVPAAGQLPGAGGTFTPEAFGAKGDGVTNDTAAFQALGRAVSANGGGTISLRPVTYVVGRQRRAIGGGDPYAYMPEGILVFQRVPRAITIQGNGARLRAAPGLRYGTFNRRTGAATKHPMPFLDSSEIALPYYAMISAEECSGAITISDVELDGNLKAMVLGGPYGDTGWQIPGTGIFLRNNRGNEIVRNVHTHHHPQDGVTIDGLDDAALARRVVRRFEKVRCEYNGRQGVSIVGGRGYAFADCKFNHTGRAGIASSPGAGVDIEAEDGKKNRDFSFLNCEFVNNFGCGMVADSGDSEGATFTGCTFVGTTAWAAWPYKPRFRFHNCRFVGASVRPHGDPDPERATQFHDCTFLDDPRLSPTGEIYLGGHKNYAIFDQADSKNVLFNRCAFRLTHNGLLPWSWFAIYKDCKMEQRAKVDAYPKGKYLGTSTLNGQVDMYGTNILGTLILNGKSISKAQLGGVSW